MIVVDTNVLLYLYLPGPYQPLSEQVLKKDPEWIVPYLWRSEFRNALAAYLRRQLITLNKARQIMGEAELLLQDSEYHVVSADVLFLLMNSTCSAYDCEFVALAQEYGVPLVTVDKKVLAAFPNTAVSLDQFLAS